MTLRELVDFVIANRRGKAFENWTPIQIAEAFIQGIEDRTLLFAMENDTLVGVVHCERFGCVMYVHNILATKSGVLRQFVQRFKELYPQCRLEAHRHGRRKIYNTERFKQKVLNYG